MEKNFQKNMYLHIPVYITESTHCTPETTQSWSQLRFSKNFKKQSEPIIIFQLAPRKVK